jgi:hypothetical protein
MIRIAASTDLRPDQFWEMTERELELWMEGQTLKWERIEDVLSWLQANLINIHIPRGKPKLTVEKIRPKRQRPAATVDDVSDDDIRDSMAAFSEQFIKDPVKQEEARERRLMRAEARRENRRFWRTREGATLEMKLAAYD